MSALINSIRPAGEAPHVEALRRRETALSRLITSFISAGLVYMLLPGTFLGVWNLITISAHSRTAISPAWMQAHGHAQLFGWVGTFILGIGFYSIPKMRRADSFALPVAWTTFALWVSGVGLRWFANVYLTGWRILLPVSGALELVAFVLFVKSVAGHRPATKNANEKPKMDRWIFIVMAGTLGLLIALLMNLAGCIRAAVVGATPAFEHAFDLTFLAVCAWVFLVPFVLGFSAKWLPVFLGLRPPQTNRLLAVAGLNYIAVVLIALGFERIGAAMFILTSICAAKALGLFARTVAAPKVRDVDSWYPYFIRCAYVWLVVAALLGFAASFGDPSGGLGGASRHALTVGFAAMMIFTIGQRVLPAFAGMRILYSKRLMRCSMVLLAIGCTLRVSSEALAYPGYVPAAWKVLPVSAIFELVAVTIFATNLLITFSARTNKAVMATK